MGATLSTGAGVNRFAPPAELHGSAPPNRLIFAFRKSSHTEPAEGPPLNGFKASAIVLPAPAPYSPAIPKQHEDWKLSGVMPAPVSV